MGPIARPASALFLAFLFAASSVRGDDTLPWFASRPAVDVSSRALPMDRDRSDLRTALERGPAPRSLAAADLDGDGMPELAAGFARDGGSGLVAVWRGNPDALFPRSESAARHREEGTFTDAPFLGPPLVLFLPEVPEMLAVRDVDGDGAADLLATSRGGATGYRFLGDGAGGLAAASVIEGPRVDLLVGALIPGGDDPEHVPWREVLSPRRQGAPVASRAFQHLSNVAGLIDPDRVVAAVSLRLNADAWNDLVVLEEGRVEPTVLVTTAAAAFTIDSVADDADFDATDGLCDTDDGVGDGPCTLRAALQEANGTTGGVTIDFAIPQPNVYVIHQITPATPLPGVELGSLTLDASAQAVVLSGADLPGTSDGLVLNGSFNVIRGLRIQSVGGSAIAIHSSQNVVEGCWIGRVFGAQQAVGNVQGIQILDSSNTIGGATAAARNVISGNGLYGIKVAAGLGDDPLIQGNFIGTDPPGLNSILDSGGGFIQQKGVWVAGGRPEIVDNLISSNLEGISVTDVDRTLSSPALILGNSIGTDVNGTAALPNDIGILLSPLVGQFTIGGPGAGEGNLISGNTTAGIWAYGSDGYSPELRIYANLIGTDVTGTAALPNGVGVALDGAGAFVAIGTTAGAPELGNLISGNTEHGVLIRDHFGAATQHRIGENFIGTDVAGTGDLGNGGWGLVIDGPAGGSEVSSNRIAFNGGGGIAVGGTSDSNLIELNAIFSNGGLGIDLFGVEGVDLNDAGDADGGPNHLQNAPVIESLASAGGSTQIMASLRSLPDSQFTVDFYSSPACDPSGFGEGATYLGRTAVTTDADGYGAVGLSTTPSVPAGHYVTATATEEFLDTAAGRFYLRTSEFSRCRREDAVCPHPPDLVLAAGTIADPRTYSACETITTAGGVVVEQAGSLELRAGRSVALGDGFQAGGSLRVVIDPSLSPGPP